MRPAKFCLRVSTPFSQCPENEWVAWLAQLVVCHLVQFPGVAHSFTSCSIFHKFSVTGERISTEYWLSLPRKSEVRVTDRPHMTSAIYLGRRVRNKTNQNE